MIFTVGLTLSTVGPGLLGHALLRYRGRRLDSLGRVGVAVAYLSTTVLAGVGPAVFFEPPANNWWPPP